MNGKTVKKKAKSLLRIVFGRTFIIMLLVLIQFGLLFASLQLLSMYVTYIYSGFAIIGLIVILYIINTDMNPAFKIAWCIPICISPVVGSLFYLYFKFGFGTLVISKRLSHIIADQKSYLLQDADVMETLKKEDITEYGLVKYMNNYGGYPIYKNTTVQYFESGEAKFKELLVQLKEAKEYIFMEYFIVEEGIMWNAILEVLKHKVAEGVEVRVMYDGMCSVALLPYTYPKQLRRMGIKAKMFSPIRPVLSSVQNNRDHRKIVVIDGLTAFTGGINFADEYINEYERFGYWKDTAVMLKGDAVSSFTLMFLQMWNISEAVIEPNDKYIRYNLMKDEDGSKGFVMPYGDSPLDHENVGELVYMDILNRATDYVHITTPYLILDNEMATALKYAAKRGVEVIIIMPHIPDKVYAYLLARTYYPELIEAGVKIYEFEPGFIHAKGFVSDDIRAVVGSINLDYRSLYLHFECAAYMYNNPAVKTVEEDFNNTLKSCIEITLLDCKKYNIFKKWAGKLLRLVAPLM